MPNGGSIEFSIGFNVDKTGLKDLQNELNQIQQMTTTQMKAVNPDLELHQAEDQLNAVKQTASEVSIALQNAFNADLGTVNLTKFSQQLQGLKLNEVYTQFSSIGTVGQNAFRSLSAQLLSTNTQLQQSHTLLDSMADTMGRTVKWGVASSMMNRLVGSVQEAYGYVKNLDTSLNNIQIVTQKSAEDMAEFAVQANNAAKALGASTTDYTNASLIYYQQGLSDEEVAARTDVTLKTANVTGQTAREVSEELTAVWNGYQKTSEEAESSIDVLAAVAANTASNLEELATGMSTVASAANTMGVSEEQLAAQLSTIISATRQGPEMTGRALRTIYARMSTINAGGIDEEDGATLTSYTAKMDKFGISVLDANGKLRDMGDVIEEIGGKWNDFSREQQVAIAQAMAGTRQYNNIMALFENWDEYERALDIASNSVGTLQQQQDTYMESTAAHLQQLETAWEDVFDSILSGSDINALVDMFIPLVNGAADFIDAIGGGIPLLTSLGSVGVSVFSTQIGRGITSMISNLRIANQELSEQHDKLQLAQQFGMDFNPAPGVSEEANRGINELYNQAKDLYGVNINLTKEEKEQVNALLQQKANLENQKAGWDEQIKAAKSYLENLTKINTQERNMTDLSNVNVVGEDKQQKESEIQTFSDFNQETYETYITEINMSIGEGIQKAQELKDILAAAPEEAIPSLEQFQAKLRESFAVSDTSGALDQNTAAYEKLISALSETEDTEKKVKKAEEELREATKDSGKAVQENTENLIAQVEQYRKNVEAQKALEALNSGDNSFIQQAEKTLKVLEDSGHQTDTAYTKLQESLEKVKTALEGENKAVSPELYQKLAESLNEASIAADGVGESVKRTFDAMAQGEPNVLADRLEVQKERFQELKAQFTDEAFYKSMANFVGSLGRVASGIMTIQNLGNIIDNDNLSTMEKTTQILTSLGMGVTMLASALPGLIDGFKQLKSRISDIGSSISGLLKTFSSWQILIGVLAVAAIAALAYGIYSAVKASDQAKNEFNNLSNQVKDLQSSIEDCTKAIEDFNNAFGNYNDAVEALDELKEGTEEYKKALEEANAAARELIETYQLFDQYGYQNGRIVINEEALNGVQENLNNQSRTAQNNLAATQIAQQGAQTNLNFQNSDLFGTFLKSAIDVNGEIYDSLVVGTQSNWQQIGDWLNNYQAGQAENNAALLTSLMNLGDVLGIDIKSAFQEQDFEGIINALEENGVDIGNSESLINFVSSLTDADSIINRNIVTIYNNINAVQDFANSLENAAAASDYYAQSILENAVGEKYGEQIERMSTNEEGETNAVIESQVTTLVAQRANEAAAEVGDTLSEAIANIDVSDATRKSLGIGNDEDLARTYAREVLGRSEEEVASYQYNSGVGKGGFSDQEGNEVMGKVNDSFMLEQIATVRKQQELIDQYTEQLGEEETGTVDALESLVDWANDLGDTYGASITEALLDSLVNGEAIDLSSIFGELSPEDIEGLREGLNLEDFLQMTPEELEVIYGPFREAAIANGEEAGEEAGEDAGEYFLMGLEAELDKYDPTDWYNNLVNATRNAQDSLSSVMEGINSGDITGLNIGENEDFLNLNTQLESLKNKFPDLEADIEAINTTWLVGTDDYEKSLKNIQQALNDITLDSLNKQLDNATEKMEKFIKNAGDGDITVAIAADPDEFEDRMNEIMDARYAIEVEIQTQDDQVFNSALDAMDNLHDKASLIGEDFIIAARDLEELNAAFPGIGEGLEILADGSMKLNEEVVQSAIDSAQAEVEAQREAAVAKLELDAQESRNKAETYQQLSDLCADYLNGTIDQETFADQARALLSEELGNSQSDMSEQTATNEADNLKEVADYSGDTSAVMATNTANAFNDMIKSSVAFANAAAANIQYGMSGGEKGAISDTSVSSSFSKQTAGTANITKGTVTAQEIGSSQKVQEVTTELVESIQRYADESASYFNQLADSQQAQADILKAEDVSLNNTLDNIRSGGGANGKSGGGKGGSGGGGSGGGSGSGTAEEPNVEELLEDEADRYHDIDIELEKISNSLSKIQKQEDKLLGEDLIDNLNKQLSLLNNQIDATNEKIKIARGEAQEYREQLEARGATFDSTGAISNYNEIMQAALNSANAIIEAYNAMSAEEQEAYQDVVDQAKQDYQDIQDLISKYDQIWFSDIPEMEESVIDAADEKIQINIQKFTAEIEVRLDMREAEKDWNEFYRKVVLGLSSDDIFGNALQDMADIVSYFDTTATDVFHRSGNDISDWVDAIEDAFASGGGEGTIYKLEEQIQDTMDQLDEIRDGNYASVYGNNAAQAFEDLQTYYNELMDELEDIYDLVDDIKDAYLDMIDEAIDKFDEQVDQYEYINDLLNHDIELIGLLYGDDAYAEMARYYQQIEDNNNQELDFLRKRVDYAYEMMQAETDDEARKKWQDEWEDALSQLNDKVEESVQNIIDKYSNTINQIISELNDAVTNGLGLDYVSDEWDLINQAADIYLDQINEAYEIQAIRNKYLEAIDATDSVYAQQKLNEAMEMELSYLEEKDNLTQTDVDRAELLYQITLAQIALDEAQQNKSTMRLRRDSQGNYSYQYVSDQDEIAQAQQELLDLQNQLYNFDKDAYQENLDDLYSIYEEFQEKILELYEDQTLSAEEREQQIALYVEYYGEIINDLVTENTYLRMNLEQSAFEELAALYDFDVENFRNMSEEEIEELMTNLIPQWDSGVQHMADTFAGEGGFIPTCERAFEDLNQATLDYQDSLDTLEQAAGVDFESIATGYDMNIQLSEQLLKDNDALIESYREMIDVLSDLIAKLEEYLDVAGIAYATRTVASGYNYTQDYYEEQADAYRDAYEEALEGYTGSTATVVATIPTYTPGEVLENPTPVTTTQGNGIPEVGDTATYTGGLYYYDSYGTSPTGSRGAGGTVTITQVKTDGRPYPIHVESTNSAYGWLKQSQLSGYDTGGYTGEWENGDDGAVALLHQKELVLNQTDTENILTAVGLVRDMSAMLSALDTSVLARMSDLKSSLIDNLAEKFENGNQELEQNVHIEASFPNVRDSQEIEDAFNNLVNIASMHAYRTQR